MLPLLAGLPKQMAVAPLSEGLSPKVTEGSG